MRTKILERLRLDKQWYVIGLPRWLIGKESAWGAGDGSSIPGSGRSPGGGNDSSLQYSCLADPMDRGAWRPTVRRLQRVGPNLGTKQQQQVT